MARKFLTPIDLNGLELQNAVIQNLNGDPSNATGKIYFNVIDNALKVYNGSAWTAVGKSYFAGNGISTTSDIISIVLDSNSGLAVSSTGLAIDLDPTAGLAISSAGIAIDLADSNSGLTLNSTGLAVDTSYIATKAYADGLAAGLDVKASVIVATTAAGTLASSFEAGNSVGGRTLVAGDRILIKNQADPIENGIYIVNNLGAPTRATDLAAGTDFAGVFVFVESRDNGGKGYVATGNTATDVTVGTHSMNWTQFSEAGSLTAGNGISTASSQISIVLDTNSGLSVSNTGLTIDLADSNSGLELTSSGLAIDLADSNPGLELTSAGLTIALSPRNGENSDSSGLKLSSTGIYVQPGYNASTSYSGPTLKLSTSGLDIKLSNNGGGSTNWSGMTVDAYGLKIEAGTGLELSSSGLSVSSSVARTYKQTLASVTTSHTVEHNLGTQDVLVQVHEVGSPYNVVEADIQLTDSNTVTIGFAVAPSSSTYRVVVVG